MRYTVKKVSKILGVSIRTLHWYDEIGLLKPAHYSANNYRYYEEAQLLLLQQILFFRKLGFKLTTIQRMLNICDINKIKVLEEHKSELEANIKRINKLVNTINKAISHFKQEPDLRDKEFYTALNTFKQREYDQYIMKYYGTIAEDIIHKSLKKPSNSTNNGLDYIESTCNEVYREISKCIDKGMTSHCPEVQINIHKHYKVVEFLHEISKDVYISLAQLYCEHPDFIKFFDNYNPKLAKFIAEAMRFYAHTNLSTVQHL